MYLGWRFARNFNLIKLSPYIGAIIIKKRNLIKRKAPVAEGGEMTIMEKNKNTI